MTDASWAWPEQRQKIDDHAEPAAAGIEHDQPFEPDAELRRLIAGESA